MFWNACGEDQHLITSLASRLALGHVLMGWTQKGCSPCQWQSLQFLPFLAGFIGSDNGEGGTGVSGVQNMSGFVSGYSSSATGTVGGGVGSL